MRCSRRTSRYFRVPGSAPGFGDAGAGVAYGFGGGAALRTAAGGGGFAGFFGAPPASAAVPWATGVGVAESVVAGVGAGAPAPPVPSMTIDPAGAAALATAGGAFGSEIGSVPVLTSTGPADGALEVGCGGSSVDTATIADAVPTTMQRPMRKMHTRAPRLIGAVSRRPSGRDGRMRGLLPSPPGSKTWNESAALASSGRDGDPSGRDGYDGCDGYDGWNDGWDGEGGSAGTNDAAGDGVNDAPGGGVGMNTGGGGAERMAAGSGSGGFVGSVVTSGLRSIGGAIGSVPTAGIGAVIVGKRGALGARGTVPPICGGADDIRFVAGAGTLAGGGAGMPSAVSLCDFGRRPDTPSGLDAGAEGGDGGMLGARGGVGAIGRCEGLVATAAGRWLGGGVGMDDDPPGRVVRAPCSRVFTFAGEGTRPSDPKTAPIRDFYRAGSTPRGVYFTMQDTRSTAFCRFGAGPIFVGPSRRGFRTANVAVERRLGPGRSRVRRAVDPVRSKCRSPTRTADWTRPSDDNRS